MRSSTHQPIDDPDGPIDAHDRKKVVFTDGAISPRRTNGTSREKVTKWSNGRSGRTSQKKVSSKRTDRSVGWSGPPQSDSIFPT